MHFAFVGAGAVGGYYGAMLARAGSRVSFIARGAHRDAIASKGITVLSEAVGDFTANAAAETDPARIGPVDVAILATKTYDNPTAIPLLRPLVGPATTVLTLQNGVESVEEVSAVVGEAATIGGSTYIATAIEGPGVIRQTGSHRRIVLGECHGTMKAVSDRVSRIEAEMKAADIHAEAVVDAREAIWEKFTYLAPFAAVTGAARLPIGPLWADPDAREVFLAAVEEVAAVARAHGIAIPADRRQRVEAYANKLPPSTRSSLLIDLQHCKRIEVEALQGSVVRRGRNVGVPTPIMAALYAVLKPYVNGPIGQ
jgi:2-dehydropantoate 2-reductase